MANLLIATPIKRATTANLLQEPAYRAMDAASILPLLINVPCQRVCVVFCSAEVEYTRLLESYNWVIFVDNQDAFDAVVTQEFHDMHHQVRVVNLV